jgi:hypothetical protein
MTGSHGMYRTKATTHVSRFSVWIAFSSSTILIFRWIVTCRLLVEYSTLEKVKISQQLLFNFSTVTTSILDDIFILSSSSLSSSSSSSSYLHNNNKKNNMSDDDAVPFDGMSSLLRMIGFNVPVRAHFLAEALVSSTLSSITLGVLGGMIGSSILPIGPLVPFFIGSWTGYTVGLIQHWKHAQKETLQMAHYYPTILGHGLYTEFGIVVPPNVLRVVPTPAAAVAAATNRSSGRRKNRHRSVVPLQKDEQENDDSSEAFSTVAGAANERTLSTTTTTTTTVASCTAALSTTSPMEDWIRQGGIGRLTWSILAAQSCRSDIKDLQRQERQRLMDAHNQQRQQQDNDDVDDDEDGNEEV